MQSNTLSFTFISVLEQTNIWVACLHIYAFAVHSICAVCAAALQWAQIGVSKEEDKTALGLSSSQ